MNKNCAMHFIVEGDGLMQTVSDLAAELRDELTRCASSWCSIS
jgi:hypothetical protein